MRLAIVADWLTTFGGAEHVLHEFAQLYPEAPFYTTVSNGRCLPGVDIGRIRTSSLQWWYNLLPKHQALLPLMPRAMEDLDVRGFDVLLSSSHAVGKAIIPPSTSLHVCYCHTPMRYAWEMEDDYLRDFRIPRFLIKPAKRILRRIRRWDMTTAKRVDHFIANSTTTQERIARIYGRESVVIPPPVDDRFFATPLAPVVPHPSHAPYFLAVGRLVPYKRFDLLIELANSLKLPLKIAGRGQDEQRLRSIAGPTVEFLGFVPDDRLPALYAHAEALFFPQFEDAGIVLLEAMACGTPVIAYKAGGALDAVKDGHTGIFFEAQTVDSMRTAIERFKTVRWSREAIREHVVPFSGDGFRERVRAFITDAYMRFLQDKSPRQPHA